MSEGDHTHSNKHLTLDDVQMIIGRAMVDESFRAEFTSSPEATLKKLHISMKTGGEDDAKSVALINDIANALKEENAGASLGDALNSIRQCYLASADGVVRPRCA